MSEQELRQSAQRVQDWLAERGFACQVLEMPASTRTSQEAAQAAGCTVAQIAKSLVMIGKKTGTFYLIIASGPNRVDLKMVSKLLGEPVKMAPAEAVKDATGFRHRRHPASRASHPAHHGDRRGFDGANGDLGGGRHPARGVQADAQDSGGDHRRPGGPGLLKIKIRGPESGTTKGRVEITTRPFLIILSRPVCRRPSPI